MQCPVKKVPSFATGGLVDPTHSSDGKLYAVQKPIPQGGSLACSNCAAAWGAGKTVEFVPAS